MERARFEHHCMHFGGSAPSPGPARGPPLLRETGADTATDRRRTAARGWEASRQLNFDTVASATPTSGATVLSGKWSETASRRKCAVAKTDPREAQLPNQRVPHHMDKAKMRSATQTKSTETCLTGGAMLRKGSAIVLLRCFTHPAACCVAAQWPSTERALTTMNNDQVSCMDGEMMEALDIATFSTAESVPPVCCSQRTTCLSLVQIIRQLVLQLKLAGRKTRHQATQRFPMLLAEFKERCLSVQCPTVMKSIWHVRHFAHALFERQRTNPTECCRATTEAGVQLENSPQGPQTLVERQLHRLHDHTDNTHIRLRHSSLSKRTTCAFLLLAASSKRHRLLDPSVGWRWWRRKRVGLQISRSPAEEAGLFIRALRLLPVLSGKQVEFFFFFATTTPPPMSFLKRNKSMRRR